jgi:hypothetical protein
MGFGAAEIGDHVVRDPYGLENTFINAAKRGLYETIRVTGLISGK